MVGLLLGITIPIAYVVLGSAIGFRLRDSRVGCDCHWRERGDSHRQMCDNAPVSVLGAVVWPLIPLIWVGYSIAHRKRVFGFRARRAEKVAKRIAQMEKEIWGETFSG